jgi:hypothetical protein
VEHLGSPVRKAEEEPNAQDGECTEQNECLEDMGGAGRRLIDDEIEEARWETELKDREKGAV